MDETNYSAHSSIYVAPLRIDKIKRSSSGVSRKSRTRTRPHSRSYSQGAHSHSSSQSHREITPPPTPSTSQDTFSDESFPEPSAASTFHPYLRAFYPFHPDYTPESSTVTLPLNIGDVVLVHSVHTNGWADGTMLSSGARGWLPTNYCEPYDVRHIRLLLKACSNLFEQFRGGVVGGLKASQNAVTAVVAGVRTLLDRTQCLTREAPIVKSSDGVRKSRKLLLTELSGLVKAAKRLPGHAEYATMEGAVEDLTDEMILRMFKIVLRGVRFLDIWFDESAALEADYYEDGDDRAPLTPPADSLMHPASNDASLHNFSVSESNTDNHYAPHSSGRAEEEFTTAPDSASEKRHSRPLSSTQTPRASRIGLPPVVAETVQPDIASTTSHPNYALARLNTTHDILLSYLGSYIGRIHLQARFTPQLQHTQEQSVEAARELLQVVEAVYARDNYKARALGAAKEAMYQRIATLVSAAREIVANRVEDVDEEEDGGIMIPDSGKGLVDAATGCVRGAGECVAKSKFVIERLGDFELEFGNLGIGLGITNDAVPSYQNESQDTLREAKEQHDRELMPPPPTPDKIPPPPPPKKDSLAMKELPSIPPLVTDPAVATSLTVPPSPADSSSDIMPSVHPFNTNLLPPLPTMTPLLPQEGYNAPPTPQRVTPEPIANFQIAMRTDSIGAASSTATDSTFDNSLRGSEFSLLSQTSTRDTSPEPSSCNSIATPLLNTELGSQISLISGSGSEAFSQSTEDLTFNKDGQITGGTLPALVERLTIHDATPDAVFVATFLLTFRLFTTPRQFAETLVDRFDSVTTNPQGAMPVRLRVYNVFKGWLESHWRHDCDEEAVAVIREFADTRLQNVLPAACKRLEELADKVTAIEGPIVPRLVSGMGKAPIYSVPETPIPAPNVTQKQLNMLRAALQGGAAPTILDFDPLELARQFTLKESRMFCRIRPEELIAQEWTKKTGSTATNVLAMSSLSTDLAHLVAETILDVQDAKKRAIVIKHWIKVADRCLELNNYDSLMAIMCTMNTSTIVRLKRTWELVSNKTKLVLEHLRSVIDVSKNHAVLRARLRSHVPPCLPFLGTYLTDLTFIDVGNPSKRPISVDGTTKQLINFDKHVKTSRVISELQRFQIPYRIAEVPEMQQWLDSQIERIHNSKTANVQQLYRRSLLLEPRENQLARTATMESPVPPPPPSIKDVPQKTDLFAWTHVFKAPAPAPSS